MMNSKSKESCFVDGIKRIAYDNVNKSTEKKLIKWWTNKYKLPPTDDRLLAYTVEELFLEYCEDLHLENPQEAAPLLTQEEIDSMSKEDEQIQDVNPIFLERGKKVDLSKFQVKKDEDK